MEKIIYGYFPQKASCEYKFEKTFLSSTPKWIEEENKNAEGRYTVIVKKDKEPLWEIDMMLCGEASSSEEIEKQVQTLRKQAQEAVQRKEKTKTVRAVARGIGYLGAAVVLMGTGGRPAYVGGSSFSEKVRNKVDDLFDVGPYSLQFDEERYREDFYRFRETDTWVKLWDKDLRGKMSAFRGVPKGYVGKKNPSCCIHFRIGENKYKIIEHPGVSVADNLWSVLQEQGFAYRYL